MSKQIELLAALQDVDLSLTENTRAVDARRATLADLDADLAAKTEALEAATTALADLESRQRELEGRLEDIEVKVKDRRMRVARIRNERELAVVRHEIEVHKEESSTFEGELLLIYDRIDGARTARDEAQAAFDEAAKERETAAAALAETVEETRSAIERDEARRSSIAKDVDEALQAQYERIFGRRGGLAVVPARNGTCQGCHMNVPPQLYNQVLRNEQIHLCPNCQRILFAAPPSDDEEG